jgi:dihydrofolate reductase
MVAPGQETKMSKVFADMVITLDGFVAGENRGVKNPMGENSMAMKEWIFALRAFRKHLHLGDGGDTGPENDMLEATFARIGANIMGRRMFEEGEAHWPEDAPFHRPVFVLSHKAREPWVRKGGTTFYFVTDGIASALKKAREAAGSKDVRICGGADCVRQYLNAGEVEELTLHVSQSLMGKGLRLYDGLDANRFSLEQTGALVGKAVTHLTYKVINKA